MRERVTLEHLIELSRENKRLRANNSQQRDRVKALEAQRDALLTALGQQVSQEGTERIVKPTNKDTPWTDS